MLMIILAVGAKLQSILTKMAVELVERHTVVQGIPLVQASDKHFWFSKPHLMLHLIHFALFQYEYKINSCFLDNMKFVIVELVIGVGVLILCSYTTLPLYALLSQMGSTLKKSIFDEHTAKALKKWRMAVKRKHGDKTPRSTATSLVASPVHPMASVLRPTTTGATLHRFHTTGHSTRSNFTYEDTDVSNFEGEPLSPESSTRKLLDVRVDYHSDNEIELDHVSQHEVETNHVDDFSFSKPAPPK
ncbi:hypothetical protein L2E82_11324 [Cichorium intybus]|uniref:Uncharacterized protein n=1 Tax=Cichorium intybus TaxID=13427 RepID=A0ACB9GCH5_CICIN|nr:hypothetical protein L2E82_11324 [Cichorium intybus]